MLLNFIKLAGWQLSGAAICWMKTFLGGNFLSGNYPGGKFPGGSFPSGSFSGWEFSGWDFSGGSFPGWELFRWDLSWVGISLVKVFRVGIVRWESSGWQFSGWEFSQYHFCLSCIITVIFFCFSNLIAFQISINTEITIPQISIHLYLFFLSLLILYFFLIAKKDLFIYLLMQSIFSISSNQFYDLNLQLKSKHISWKVTKNTQAQRS